MQVSILQKYSEIDFNKWTNYFFIAFAFAIPISKALDSLFAALIIISWLLEGNFYTKFKLIKEDRLSLIFIFLIFFSLLSLLWSPDITHAIKFILIKYWNFFIIPIMLTSLKVQYIKYIFNAFLLSMFISEIVSYGIFFEIWTYNNVPPSDPSPFMNHTDYATFLSFTLIIILSKLFSVKEKIWKIIYSLYFITALSNLFINGGRTGQVTFIVAILTLSIFYFKFSFQKIISIILLLIALLIFAYSISPNFYNRMNQLQTEMSNMYYQHDFRGSLATRLALWRLGTATFFDNPLLGTGIGGETKQLEKYHDKYNFKIATSYTDYHNTFVQYAVQLGIIGLLIPIIVFYLLFTLKFKTKRYKMLSIAFSTIYLLHAMGGFSFHILDSLVFLCVFASLFNAITHIEKNSS